MKLANFINPVSQKMVQQAENVVQCLYVDHMVAVKESELEWMLLSANVQRVSFVQLLGWDPP